MKYWCAYHFSVQNNINKNTKSNVIGVNSNYYMSNLFFSEYFVIINKTLVLHTKYILQSKIFILRSFILLI